MRIRVAGAPVLSLVDGPGDRAVVHTTGCSIGCPGCFNSHLQDAGFGGYWDCSSLALACLELSSSVTISGGEPTEQTPALIEFLRELRAGHSDDILLFTGREFRAVHPAIVGLVDVIIDGPYVQRLRETGSALRGSTNQGIHCLTGRYQPHDIVRAGIEVHVHDTHVLVTGFPPEEFMS